MNYIVCLEIGEQYLKLVAAKSAGQDKAIFCAIKPIHELKDEDIAKMIKASLEESGAKPRSLIVNLPRNLATMRNLHLPSRDSQEISQMIELHIGRIVPYKNEEICFDHLSVSTDSLGYTAQMLAIVHKDIIKRYQSIISAAGYDIDRVFLSSYGVWQWVATRFRSNIKSDEIYLLLDIDSLYTDFIIFNSENILFSRTLAFHIRDVIPHVEINKFVGEIKQSLLIFHKNESINKKPAAIFISGVSRDAVNDVIKKEFETPVWMAPEPVIEGSRTKPPEVARDLSITALNDFVFENKGKRLSFALPEMIVRRSLKDKTRELTILGTLLFYIFTAIMLFFWGEQYSRQSYLKKLALRGEVVRNEMGPIIDQYRRIGFVKDFIYERKKSLLLLNEVEKLVPAEIVINYISMEGGDLVTLRGQGSKLSDVFKFVTTLENSKYFRDVTTKYTKTRKAKDRELTDFEISFSISLTKKI